MKVVKINQIKEITKVLQLGGVVALPTDTAYALAADATNPKAVKKVFAIKGRATEKQFSWFFADIDQVKEYAQINNYQFSILNSYLPGPYTFIVESKNGGTLGVRVTDHSVTQQVVKAFGKPLTATSANKSGEPPIRSVEGLKKLDVGIIVDGGAIPDRQSSTVVDLTQVSPMVIRRGLGQFPKSS